MRKRTWSEQQLREAAIEARSIRQILFRLGLKMAGGNYKQINHYLKVLNIKVNLKGKGWSAGSKIDGRNSKPLSEILIKGSSFQSYKLKKRLFKEGLKQMFCEECGWSKKSPDGRLPLELDHINGDANDNQLENLRILCPNCHSLKPTHRGLNKKKIHYARVVEG
ncbi:HNH endonuclease [Candidatus Uhrbacteria bacterium]|nr:HNH endonuclease [Candidatus Uhrbacteria bacterium]